MDQEFFYKQNHFAVLNEFVKASKAKVFISLDICTNTTDTFISDFSLNKLEYSLNEYVSILYKNDSIYFIIHNKIQNSQESFWFNFYIDDSVLSLLKKLSIKIANLILMLDKASLAEKLKITDKSIYDPLLKISKLFQIHDTIFYIPDYFSFVKNVQQSEIFDFSFKLQAADSTFEKLYNNLYTSLIEKSACEINAANIIDLYQVYSDYYVLVSQFLPFLKELNDSLKNPKQTIRIILRCDEHAGLVKPYTTIKFKYKTFDIYFKSIFILFIVFILFSFFLVQSKSNLDKANIYLNNIQNTISTKTSDKILNTKSLIDSLYWFNKAVELAKHSSKFLFFSNSNDLLRNLIAQDKALLLKYYVPILTEFLNTELTISTDTTYMYSALRVYDMFINSNYLDGYYLREFIKHNLSTYNSAFNNSFTISEFYYLAKKVIDLKININDLNKSALIDFKKILAKKPPIEIAYAILKNFDQNICNLKIEDIFSNNVYKIFGFAENNLSCMYASPKVYGDIYNILIPKAATMLVFDDSLLYPGRSKNDIQILIEKLRSLYKTDYNNNWRIFISNLRIPEWQSDKQAIEYLNTLLSKEYIKAYLADLSYTGSIENNSAKEDYYYELLKGRINIILQFFSQNYTDAEYSSFLSKKNYSKQFNYIIDKLETTKFNNGISYAANYLINLLNDRAIKLIKFHADKYYKNIWKRGLGNFYVEHIQNYYPLNFSSTKDMQIDDFIQFFNPANGMYKSFVSSYLNNHESQLQSSKNYSANWYDNLNIMNKITQLFFQQDGQLKSIEFYLRPIKFGPGVTAVKFACNDQYFTDKVSDDSNSIKYAHTINWNLKYDKHPRIRLQLYNKKASADIIMQGPWSLFRIIKKFSLNKSDASKFRLVFDINGMYAEYEGVLKFNNETISPKILYESKLI